MRGSSGARVIFDDPDTVLKTGGDRVSEQGRWLTHHSSPAVPVVCDISAAGWYRMERLVAAPAWALDHRAVFRTMFSALSTHVWSHEAEVRLDHEMLRTKLKNLVRPDAPWPTVAVEPLVDRVLALHAEVRWDDLHACLTHGDPTFDNVLFREDTGELVLADPVPASPAVPDLRCVDVGKILQSCVGWECVRYGDVRQTFLTPVAEVRFRVPDDNEWRASVFWSAVHLLRTLPYVDRLVTTSVVRMTRDALLLL